MTPFRTRKLIHLPLDIKDALDFCTQRNFCGEFIFNDSSHQSGLCGSTHREIGVTDQTVLGGISLLKHKSLFGIRK